MDDKLTTKQAITVIENLKDWLYFSSMNGGTSIQREAIDMAIKALEQPEIVRCKDCKYARLTNDGSCKYCDIWFPDEAEYMDGDYYCASAERKSNG